jgi:hypothetical protein
VPQDDGDHERGGGMGADHPECRARVRVVVHRPRGRQRGALLEGEVQDRLPRPERREQPRHRDLTPRERPDRHGGQRRENDQRCRTGVRATGQSV